MKIICIGRNYSEHITELNNSPSDQIVVFLKPDTALLGKEQDFYLPEFSKEIQHEVELVVKIAKVGKYIEQQYAHKYYNEISVGVDFTARDLQNKLKSEGLPWEKAKAFDSSALVGTFIPKTEVELNSIDFELYKNEVLQQKGNTSQMIYTIDQIIAEVSKYFTLKTGDLIFTGTPKGVSTVQQGDVLEGKINGKQLFKIRIK